METKTFTYNDGVEIKVEYINEMRKETSFADGYNIEIDKKFEELKIIVIKNGNVLLTGTAIHKLSEIVNDYNRKRYNQAIVSGSDFVIENSEKDIVALKEEKGRCVFDYVNQIIEHESKSKKTEINENNICPKCGTYCYGDCEAN